MENFKLLDIDPAFAGRYLNDGFSGGEKKRLEILQLSMLKPKVALLDETDSGLDIDALKAVANGVNTLRDPERAIVLVTHYQRLLDYIEPDYVHVLSGGRIIRSGDKSLALELEDKGYEWVQEAAQGGADLLCGGRALSESCYGATVLFDPPETARVSTEEIFGPVVCVYPYRDLDEAIARANELPYAFQAAVFSRDLDTIMRASRRLDAAAVMVNDHTAFRVDWMPFGGLKQSGLGVGGIPYTTRDMQIEKLVVIRSKELG